MPDLVDLTRWVGTGIAVVGAFVVSPQGTVELWQAIVRWLRARERQAEAIVRKLGRRPKSVTIRPAPARGSATGGWATVTSANGTAPWTKSTPVDERVEQLWREHSQLRETVNRDRQQLSQQIGGIRAELRRLGGQVDQGLRQIGDKIEGQKRAAAKVDARSLPVIGLGIVLTGIPDEVGTSPWSCFPVLVLSAGAATAVTVWTWRDRRK